MSKILREFDESPASMRELATSVRIQLGITVFRFVRKSLLHTKNVAHVLPVPAIWKMDSQPACPFLAGTTSPSVLPSNKTGSDPGPGQ